MVIKPDVSLPGLTGPDLKGKYPASRIAAVLRVSNDAAPWGC
jgi:hypothetical protein